MLNTDTPTWTMLEELVGMELAGWFMWMFEVELDDGTHLHAYKHRITRSYFHLAEDGRAFIFVGKHSYREIDRVTAIDFAFEGWETMRATKADLDAVDAAMCRAEQRDERI
jgi:hypothetical protein